MKNTFASILIVIVLALVVSLAVPAAASLVKPSKSTTEGREYQLIGVNIIPINVKTNGTMTATGYVQYYNSSHYPPGWQPAPGVEVHFDNVQPDGWYPQANGTTDANGYFSLTVQVPNAAGIYQYGILVPTKGVSNTTVSMGPYLITVYS